MSAGFTPGPWFVADKTCVYALNDSGANRFYLGVGAGWKSKTERTSQEEIAATARLIAAAPNMRDALFRICDAETLAEARHIADEALASLGGDE